VKRAETAHEVSLFGCLLWCGAAMLFVVLVSAASVAAWLHESGENVPPPGYIGDPVRGGRLVAQYGCPSCHSGIRDAPAGEVGPPLELIGRRAYIAGQFPNTRIRMVEWLQHPQALKPGTAMPDLGVTERDARDIATYLATLK